MKSVKLNDLMNLERILLEIDVKYKFELSFNDVYTLYTYLKDVGKITNFFFLIQNEFHKVNNDAEKLKEYHNKLMDDSIDFDYEDITKFIDRILNMYGDKEFNSLVENIKFWQ